MAGMTTPATNPLRLYQRVAAAIGQAIADGRYQPGQRLASERDLAEEFGAAVAYLSLRR